MMFVKNIFFEEKNNLVVGVYGVFGLVSYHNNNIEVAFLRFSRRSNIILDLNYSPIRSIFKL